MSFIEKVIIKLNNLWIILERVWFYALFRLSPNFFNNEKVLNDIHPFGYSYPEEYFIMTNPHKTQVWAEVIPGFKETYRFGQELEYNQMYQSSKFAFTWKKGGWDCLRHYEIIANGAVPVFRDIDFCPDSSLINLPKDLFKLVNKELIPWKSTIDSEQLYQTLLTQIREYTFKNATCEAMARKFLEIVKLPTSSRILLLTCDPKINYSREFTFIGLNRVLKINGGVCISYPEIRACYRDFPEKDSLKLYGKGFGYSRKLDRSHPLEFKKIVEKDIRKSILGNQWDYILFGKVGLDETSLGSLPNLPFWEEVNSNYPKEKIGFLYGGDQLQDLTDIGSRYTRHLFKHANYGSCFVRELKK
jgi:hypothetical protein